MSKVSIITVVFNGEKYLEHTINSVLGQTYKNIEYIIIDGGSTDGSLAIIKKYESRLAYWISEKDKGIADAFNKGVARATGEIVGLINADDWYEPDAVRLAVEQMKDADIVFGDMQLWKNGQKEFILKGNFGFLEKEMTINHPTVFVKRKCYEQFGVFDLSYKFAMDYDLLLRMKINHCRFSYTPHLLANMRWDGVSDKYWMLGCKETLAVKNKYLPGKKARHTLYYFKHLLAIRMSKLLSKSRLSFFTRLYRNYLAPVKKTYN